MGTRCQDKQFKQTSRLGLSLQRSGCKILLDPSLQHAWSPSASVLCRWTSCFPHFHVSCTLVQPQSHPQHVCPVASASAAIMGNLDVRCAQGCITEQWDTPMGFWLAVKLQGGYFLPGQTESAPLAMMWQCRGCRERITRSSCSQC